jgi:sulfite reductase alpha subunit-like flavoprotein
MLLLFSGDHLAVYPINNEELVNKLGELLGVNLDTIITLTNTDGTKTYLVGTSHELKECIVQ